MTQIIETRTTTGTVWVRVDGRNVAAMDWTDGTRQADIDAAVQSVAFVAADVERVKEELAAR